MLLSQFEGRTVIDARGRVVGKVTRGLFDAQRPVLVGFEVRLKPLAHLIERPMRYVPRTGVTLSKAGLTVERRARLERVDGGKGGVDWEQAVVWTGMPVATESGTEPLGVLKDADLGAEGRVKSILLTLGAASDAAIGTREIEGAHVRGYANDAIRVDDVLGRTEFSGGLAAGAGRGAAVAKVKTAQAATGAVKGAAAAARAAKRSGVGKRASDSWKGFARGLQEGLREDDTGDAPARRARKDPR